MQVFVCKSRFLSENIAETIDESNNTHMAAQEGIGADQMRYLGPRDDQHRSDFSQPTSRQQNFNPTSYREASRE